MGATFFCWVRNRGSYTRSTRTIAANFYGKVALGTAGHWAEFNGEAQPTAGTLIIHSQTTMTIIRSLEEVCSLSTCELVSKPGTRRHPSPRALAHSAAVPRKWRHQRLFPV